jgi:hypothetical protein
MIKFKSLKITLLAVSICVFRCRSIEKDVVKFPKESNYISVIAGGDVQFDLKYEGPRVITEDYHRSFYQRVCDKIRGGYRFWEGTHFPQYILNTGQTDQRITWSQQNAIYFNLHFENKIQLGNYPFKKISQVIAESDIAFVNLETPIADKDSCRIIGDFVSDPIFAKSLSNAGIDIVSIANNHAWDASEKGFLRTMHNLDKAGVEYVGGGINLRNARNPVIFDIHGTKIAFLAYSQQFKYRFASTADNNNPGILPFSLPLIIEDIGNTKPKCDLIFVALHWGMENTSKVHPMAVQFAHKIIDAGADAILGSHSHVPKGIEVYKGRPIFYSFGNFIFGVSTEYWQHDNFLGKIYIADKKIYAIEILPISGKGEFLYQPFLLEGTAAKETLSSLKKLSIKFNTKIFISESRGFIFCEKNF